MPNIIELFWQSVASAEAGLYDFLLLLNEFSVRFFESEFAIGLFGAGASFASVVEKHAWIPYIFLLFALLEAFFGRQLLAAQKLVAGFVVGFAIGAVYVAPTISSIIDLDHTIVGVAFGIVIAVFKTPLYYILTASTLTYICYYRLVNLLHFSRLLAATVCVVAVLILLLFFKKWVELSGTALIGGLIFSASLTLLFDLPPEHSALIRGLVTFAVAAPGLFVQILLRRRRKARQKAKEAS